MKTLVCLIGGYYDIGGWDYLKIVFLLSIKVINHIYFIWDWSLIYSLCAFILPAGKLKEDDLDS